MVTNKPYLDIGKQEAIVGIKQLRQQLIDQFPKYQKNESRLSTDYNFALKEPCPTIDYKAFSLKLLEYLQTKDNFKLVCNSEVSDFNLDTNSGRVTGVRVLGKMGQVTPCDAVVLCTGAYAVRQLYQILGIRCPVVPVKGYTFDMPTDVDNGNKGLVFSEESFVAT